MGINFVISDKLFFWAAADLFFYESPRALVYCPTEEKKVPTSWMASKSTATLFIVLLLLLLGELSLQDTVMMAVFMQLANFMVASFTQATTSDIFLRPSSSRFTFQVLVEI